MNQLYEFQKKGVEFITTKKKVLLADSMGLGKTPQSIVAIQQLAAFPCIVVAPKSVIGNWKNEVEKWGSTAKVIDTKFAYNQSGLSIEDEPHFYVINYDILPKKLSELLKIPYKAVIMDEVHYAKNYRAKRSKACEKLIQEKYDKKENKNPLVVIGLSGTPIINHGTEIHQIAKLIDPYALGFSFFTFAGRYCIPARFGGYEINRNMVDQLNDRLSNTIMLRRRKEDVLLDLPAKTRVDVEVEIDEKQYKDELRAEAMILKANQQKDSQIILGLMSKERRVAGRLKAQKVVEFLLDRLNETDEKITVFAHHTDVIKTISNELRKAGFENSIYIGEMSDSERQKAIDDFRNQNRVIIISIHAGGIGINLQFANYVVFAELDWSPSQMQQAEDRAYRIGQKKNVTVYYLFAKNTIDEAITSHVVKKMQVINAVIDDIEIEAEQEKMSAYQALLRSL